MSKIAVIIVSYNHAKFLPACFESLAKADYPRQAWKIFLVDNGTDETEDLAKNKLLDIGRGTTKQGEISAEFIKPEKNTGFTGGNNLAMQKAMAQGYEYVYLLNPDTEVEHGFLSEAVRTAESDPSIGAVQSVMVLAQNPKLLNSWGNEVHFLGFSFAGGYQAPLAGEEAERFLRQRDIPTASGAAVMYKLAALRLVGLFDDAIFAYHEDVDLSLRLRLAGFRVVLAPGSVIKHHYEFSRSIKKFYFMERNRWWVHLKILRWPTLLVILPACILMELGLWFFAFRSGWWREKARAYGFLFNPRNFLQLLRERQKVQRMRTIPDRVLVRTFSPRILYQEIAHPLWEHFGNHLFALYWYAVRWLVWW